MKGAPFVPLGEVAEIRSGVAFPVSMQGRISGQYPFAKVGDISTLARSGASELSDAANHVDESDLTSIKAKVFPAGSVVFAKIGEAIRQNFRAVLSVPGLVDNNVMGVIPRREILDSRYLYHHLLSVDMYTMAQSTTVPSIRKTDLEKMALPLPALAEQQRIAAVLDRVDILRAKRREVIALIEELARSIFMDMFDDAIAADDWPVEPLARVVREGTVVTYGIVQAGEEFPNGVPYIRTGDLKNGSILLERLRRTDPQIAVKFGRSQVLAGDIVMSIRATVGTTAVVPPELEGANLTQGTARISPGCGILSSYLLAYLRSQKAQSWIQAQVKGATFREITLAKLRELLVSVPPMELQQEFARRMQSVEGLLGAHRAHLAALDELFMSLRQRAFSGRLWEHQGA